MKGFWNLSIKTKLTTILIFVSFSAVSIACLAIYSVIVKHYESAHREELQSLANIISHNSEASLAFNEPLDAVHILESLHEKNNIVFARIKKNNGEVFAQYTCGPNHPDHEAFPRISSQDYPPDGFLEITRDIKLAGSTLGTLYLYDDMRDFKETRAIILLILSVALTLAFSLSVFLAFFLQRFITTPILNLAALTHQVSDYQDYSLRAEKKGDDEIGHLAGDFNAMLETIQERESALLLSEKRFRTLVDHAVDAFFLHQIDGRFVDVNKRACDLLGYTREELLSMNVADVHHGADLSEFKKNLWDNPTAEQTFTINGESVRKNGTRIPVEVKIGRLVLEGEVYFMALVRDISERIQTESEKIKLETQLAQSRKMESIGTLAGGIAHDFNNILTSIIGYTELSLMDIDADDTKKEKLEEVLRAGNRAKELVKQILTFSRQAPEGQTPVQIHLVIKEAMRLLRASIPTSIEIRRDITNCGSVMGNPTQIHQIAMNLCTNAYYAMKEGEGVLGVALKKITISKDDAQKNINLVPGSYILLEVSDTGHGMDKETLAKIFDPYFTTKPQGQGTGMGLSVVHGIVSANGGHVSVYSEPGKGTTFRVYFPAYESLEPDHTETVVDIPRGNNERILLVDDEKEIVEMVKEILETLGYVVTGVNSPEEALSLFLNKTDSFDLMITDMAMPGLTGAQLAKEFLAVRNDLPIILCTGFSETVNEEIAKKIGIREFVMKPVVFTNLARVIRKALGR